ncbi:MAG: hypothetical protein ACYCS4_11055 [Acidimicrobiales bacterium]
MTTTTDTDPTTRLLMAVLGMVPQSVPAEHDCPATRIVPALEEETTRLIAGDVLPGATPSGSSMAWLVSASRRSLYRRPADISSPGHPDPYQLPRQLDGTPTGIAAQLQDIARTLPASGPARDAALAQAAELAATAHAMLDEAEAGIAPIRAAAKQATA